jgi:glucokinase
MTRRLGLDLGGTNIKVVVLDDAGGSEQVVYSDTVPTHAELGPAAVIDRLIEVGRVVIAAEAPITAVGIGVPGLFNLTLGTIELFPNLPGPWPGQAIRDPVAAGVGRPVTLINDARAFTLAEGTIGAGRGSSTLVCVTLGTGIGGGIMFNGVLYTGPLGVAGEIAHQTVLPDGPLCGCGNRGCAEALAKADAIAARAGRATVEEVYAGVKAGDPGCVEAVEFAAYYLGIALANTVVLLGPDRIVVGGGITQAGDIVLDPIRNAVRTRVTLIPTDAIQVVPAELGWRAGAVGAALAARSKSG